jgi:hypothetical protein
MPAIYGNEKSGMNYGKCVLYMEETDSHFFNRVLKEYFLYDFNIGFIYIIFGMPSLAFGIVYGTMELIYAASTNLPTQLEQ